MGLLVEQAIPTLFGGVSRQPASVRQPNQVQDATNALLSVVTGGAEKRPGTQLIAWLDFLDNAEDYAVHPIDRDSSEQTFILVSSSEIRAVNAITGAEITVTVDDSTRYFLIEQAGINGTGTVQVDGADMSVGLTIASGETQLDWAYSLSDAATVFKLQGSSDGSTWNDIATGKTGASGTFSTTIDAVATGDHNFIRAVITTGAGTAADTITLKATFKDLTYLRGADQEDFRLVSIADNTFLINRNVTTRMAEAGSGTITSTVQQFSDLPTPTGSGNIHRVTGTDTSGFGTYYVIDDSSTSTWIETVNPNAHNSFDASSLPHRLVRNADGTYTFSAAAWADRPAGDEDITEEPTFIGKKLKEIAFYRNRLVVFADEESYSSQSGDVLNFWPSKAVEVLDSDPVSKAATTTDVNILTAATVFRKILFATSQRAQFELTSENAFTNENASFDLATSYTSSPIARPATMADVLYFASKAGTHAVLYEYFLDEVTASNTAADVSKHVVDYIPNDVLQVVTDSTTNTVFALTSGAQNAVYVYRTFFDGTEKLQSAWAQYTFGDTEADAFVHGIAAMSGFLVLIIERQDGGIYLEQMPIEREEQNSTVGFSPFLDQREVVTGTYNSTHDVTHWLLQSEHTDDAQVVLGPSFSSPGRQPRMFYPDRYVLDLESVAAGETLTVNGLTFTAHATTTTVANREFSISGSDVADAGELATVINDATYGVPGVTATDNGNGTITLDVDDKADGSITGLGGTSITSSTIIAVELNDIVAARGNLGTNSAWVGRPYTFSVTLSEQFFRDQEKSSAVITGRLQLRDITFHLVDTGYLKATVTPEARNAYTYTFEGKILGTSSASVDGSYIADRFSFKVPVWSNSENVTITISNDQPSPCVITSAAWRGFFNELSRQE